MTWTDLTQNWAETLSQLKTRFPLIDATAIAADQPEQDFIAAHLADQHDLTTLEADEELKDWLFMQSLARQATELRSS